MNEHRPWRVLSSEVRIDTPYLRLRADRIALPDGTIVDEYFVRESRGFVVILALTAARDAVVVRQYKHGAGRVVTELPAGGIDPGETAEACARRELLEETGFSARRWHHVRTLLADPTHSNGSFHVFIASGAERTAAPDPEPTEAIETLLVPLAELRAMIADGTFEVGSQVAAALLALEAAAHIPEC